MWNVRLFAGRNASHGRHVVMFECAGLSGQTFVTLPFAVETARMLLHDEECCFVLSSSEGFNSTDPRIIDASTLRFRENAELTRYATLFIGCSSGITWLSTSDWAKPLPTIQLLRKKTRSISMVHDAQHFGLPYDHIIDMTIAHRRTCGVSAP
jgi:hypothetical protein